MTSEVRVHSNSRMQNTSLTRQMILSIHIMEYWGVFEHIRQYLKILSLTYTIISTGCCLFLHITRPSHCPRVHEIHWAAISTANSRISTGNAPVKTIAATVPEAGRQRDLRLHRRAGAKTHHHGDAHRPEAAHSTTKKTRTAHTPAARFRLAAPGVTVVLQRFSCGRMTTPK